ncbi:MAG: response regulator [Anaerolineaceae bacterium]|nr:response regulator [Anaerolineaceae bacterium]
MDHLALIVDDDPHTLMLWNAVLKPSGIEVIQAGDGSQALSILEQRTPTILLLDMLMPYVSGQDVLNFVAQTPRLNDMYVVIISAHRQPESAQLSRANAVLLKPIRPVEIRDLIQQAISRPT